MAVYCAPATRPLSRLHIAEPGADFTAAAGLEGLTLCGLVMAQGELWLPVRRLGADRVCWACLDGTGAPLDGGEQMELALVP